MRPEELLARWRNSAEDLEGFGASDQAQAVRRCAAELEESIRTAATEVLTVSQAATETGYSKDYLRQQVASGNIPNAGQPGRPRILRQDLPAPKPVPRAQGPQRLVDRVLSTDARVKVQR